jgi:hypothetical protein
MFGAHLEPAWPVRFAVVEFEVTCLAEWLNVPAFSEMSEQESNRQPGNVIGRLTLISIVLGQGATLTISSTLVGSANPLRRLSLVHSPSLRIESDSPLTLEEWLKRYITPLQQLVSLGTAGHNELTRLTVVPAVASAQNTFVLPSYFIQRGRHGAASRPAVALTSLLAFDNYSEPCGHRPMARLRLRG